MSAAVRILPRLMTEEEARIYLGGCNPASLLAPTRIGRMVRWDRDAIDRALDRMNGLATTQSRADDPNTALAEWKSRHG